MNMLNITGWVCLGIAILIGVTGIGWDTVDTYERCYICNGLPCDCEMEEVKEQNDIQKLGIGLSMGAVILFLWVIKNDK